jgi:hypothetical protein
LAIVFSFWRVDRHPNPSPRRPIHSAGFEKVTNGSGGNRQRDPVTWTRCFETPRPAAPFRDQQLRRHCATWPASSHLQQEKQSPVWAHMQQATCRGVPVQVQAAEQTVVWPSQVTCPCSVGQLRSADEQLVMLL